MSRLNGRGPVIVNPENPYLAATAFLDAQQAHSPQLAGLLKLKGYPQRIQFRNAPFADPEMMLFYDNKNEHLRATKVSSEWIFEQLPLDTSLSDASRAKELQASSAMLPTSESPTALPERNQALDSSEVRASMASRDKAESLAASSKGFKKPSPEPTQNRLQVELAPLPSAEQVATCRKEGQYRVAEATPRGDLVHYVVGERETAELIALWYSGESGPAETILRLNPLNSEIGLKTHLVIGQEMLIPRYFVRYRVRLGSEALECLKWNKQPLDANNG